MADETTPLLNLENADLEDPHKQFCLLIGIPPSDKNPLNTDTSFRTLYTRASRKRKTQSLTYNFTAALSNVLLLSQVVLGATLTALGASNSSHVLITVFGVANTIIAGLVAYLKSRGQPMRARMFLDDLEHVIDEIENSKVMWLGIKNNAHGYDEIDVDDEVSVRSEVARLSRLYESAVKKYTQNNPEMYSMGGGMLDAIKGLRSRPGQGTQMPAVGGAANGAAPAPGPAMGAPEGETDESPALAKAPNKDDDHHDHDHNHAKGQDKGKEAAKGVDKSPATAKSAEKGDSKVEEKDASKEADATAGAKADGPSATSGAAPEAGGSAGAKPEDDGADAEPATAADLPKKDDTSKPDEDTTNGEAE